jgi:serine/threonine-protein kinase HipA
LTSDVRRQTALSVILGGRRIGIINRFASERNLFSFEQDYVDDPNRPTLSLSFKGRDGGIVTSTRATATRVPPFFANLLPEGHLRTYLAGRAGVNPQREFFLLAALGADLPGGVTVTPIDYDDATAARPADLDDRNREPVLRFSLAGVQLKFSAVMESTGGLTIPANGMGGSWIVKLPSSRFPAVPENECAMLELARAIGIEVPRVRLIAPSEIQGVPEGVAKLDGHALAIERFDRGMNGARIHMEDFAQVFGLWPDEKYKQRSYANIAAVLWAEAGDESTFEFVRRLAFSTLIGNADMHLKNWSLIYPDGRTPILSPAYDFIATLPYLPNDKHALSLGGSKSLGEISIEQIRRFVDTARLPASPVAEIIRDTARLTVEAWKALPAKDLLPKTMQSTIGKQIEKVAAAAI